MYSGARTQQSTKKALFFEEEQSSGTGQDRYDQNDHLYNLVSPCALKISLHSPSFFLFSGPVRLVQRLW